MRKNSIKPNSFDRAPSAVSRWQVRILRELLYGLNGSLLLQDICRRFSIEALALEDNRKNVNRNKFFLSF